MDALVLGLLMAAFGASLGGYCWMRMPDGSERGRVFDGDHHDAEEMLAAFGTTQDWV